MSNNLLLAAVIGGAVYFVVRKQAQAAPVQTGGGVRLVAQQPGAANQTANVNSDMWKRLLGNSWTELAAGSAAIGRNLFGQAVSGDGKPISAGDPLNFYYGLAAGDAVDLGSSVIGGLELPSAVGSLFDWGATSEDSGLSWADIVGLA